MKKILLVGFGNEFRRDDGLGIKLLDFIDDISKLKVQELSLDLIEIFKDYDIVIFIDSAIQGDEISFKRIERKEKFSPLTHHMTCEEILFWMDALYKKSPEFYLLSIRGYDFDFGEELSYEGRKNLERGIEFIKDILERLKG